MSSAGTACTVRNNVPKKAKEERSKTAVYGVITLSQSGGIVNRRVTKVILLHKH